jgi:hypothetical protein
MAVGLVAALAGCSDVYEASHVDLAAAQKDGAVERGWIPEWIP